MYVFRPGGIRNPEPVDFSFLVFRADQGSLSILFGGIGIALQHLESLLREGSGIRFGVGRENPGQHPRSSCNLFIV